MQLTEKLMAIENLSVAELKALNSLTEKLLKATKETIPAGGHKLDFVCEVSALLTKAADSNSSPPFKEQPALVSWLVSWTLKQPEPVNTLRAILKHQKLIKMLCLG